MSREGRRAALVGVALMLSACLNGGVPDAELPDSPIAVSYLPPEQARRRAEARHEQAERKGQTRTAELGEPEPSDPFEQRAIATPESVGAFFDRVLGGAETDAPELRGRLALLDPRDRSITPIEAARRGSLPLAWSTDRSRLLFAQPGDRGERDYQLYEYHLDARTVHPVTHGPEAHSQGCYAADGRVVVVTVDTSRTPYASRIEVSGPGGRRPYRRLTNGPSDHTPACAPEGHAVVFVREVSPGSTALWIADLAGEAPPRRLSPGRHPAWSPDGQWIAFAAPWQRELRLWRMRPDGSGRASVGRGVRHEARPSFSPDGRLLVYVAGEDPARRQLYLRRFDGSGDRILFADGDAEYPVW